MWINDAYWCENLGYHPAAASGLTMLHVFACLSC